jgi:hypothetical protein
VYIAGMSMKLLSLKLDNDVFDETERLLKHLQTPRNRYINEALKFYNAYQNQLLLARQLEIESALVAEESLRYAQEFENMESDAVPAV